MTSPWLESLTILTSTSIDSLRHSNCSKIALPPYCPISRKASSIFALSSCAGSPNEPISKSPPYQDIAESYAAATTTTRTRQTQHYSAASRSCPSRRLSADSSAPAASAITVPGGKMASAPAALRAS
jgi:hypothetical protein